MIAPGAPRLHRAWRMAVQNLAFLMVLVGLYVISLYNYLLFHSLTELISATLMLSIFLLAWNARYILENRSLLFLGIGMFSVAALTIVHALAYQGMGVFAGYGANLSTSLWIASRYLLAFTFLLTPLFVRRRFEPFWVFLGSVAVTAALFLSIFLGPLFPVCYVEGSGPTSFKIISEYVLSALFLLGMAGFWRQRTAFPRDTFWLLVAALGVAVLLELSFTLYVGVTGFFNILGHLLLAISCWLIYQAVVVIGMREPYNLLYRNLKSSEQRLREIFTASPVGILLYDAEGKLLEVNQAVMNLFTVPDQQKLRIYRLFDSPHFSQESKEALRRGEEIRQELRFDFRETTVPEFLRLRRLEVLTLDFLVTPIQVEDVRQGYLVQVQDISQRKNAEELQADLIRAVAHDLSNPIAAIQAAMELSQDPALARKRDYQEIIFRHLRRLRTMVRNLLEMVRIEAGELRLKRARFDLGRFLEEVFEAQQPLLTEKDLQPVLEVPEQPLPVDADRSQLEEALVNILGNAVKFTPAGGRIVLRARTEDGEAVVQVEDSGPGIDAGLLPRVFERFARGGGFHSGSGLGLYLARWIVEAHGGRIAAANGAEGGAVITFWLPLAGTEEPSPAGGGTSN